LALASGSCATSGIVPWLGDKTKADVSDEIVTGSIKPSSVASPANGLPPEADLAYARAAVKDLMGAGRTTASAPWENPRTGARGTVTPIAAAYEQAGTTCRDFLASYVHEKVEAWLHGEACRAQKGAWEVKSLRPWKRS
jgi:surface antigen